MELDTDEIEKQKQDIIIRISRARNNANLSARALSQKIDMNDGYINRLESKKDFLPSLDVLLKIINVCGLTCEEFFYENSRDYAKDKEIIKLLSSVDEKRCYNYITKEIKKAC